MYILGCRLDLLDAAQATDRIVEFVRGRSGAQVVTLGTEMVVYAQRDATFRELVNRSALSLCDTVGLLLVARARGGRLRRRVAGVDLVSHVCKRAASEAFPVYMLGGAEGVAADAAAILEMRFPGLKIAGTHHGYFRDEESASIAAQIRASGARVLFAGLGAPRQEIWLSKYLPATSCGAGIGVGGSFDVISGRSRRAPHVWRKLGLEWFYRLLQEPHRWRRQLALPYFVWLLVLDCLGLTRAKGTVKT
jgi:N-acetylglucosaminyldiphosphoundecaprenol N-acetyl-beta-D-mannosaminyltransferase